MQKEFILMKLPAAIGNNTLFNFHVASTDSYSKPIADHSLVKCVGNTKNRSLFEAHFAIVGTFIFEMRSDVERIASAMLQCLLICCKSQIDVTQIGDSECSLIQKHDLFDRTNAKH